MAEPILFHFDFSSPYSYLASEKIDALAAHGTIPAGVSVELAGVSQQQSEAFGGLFASMGVAVLLVYVMMVLTFNSLVTPFIILFTLPLATIGAFVALYLTGRPIGVSALIAWMVGALLSLPVSLLLSNALGQAFVQRPLDFQVSWQGFMLWFMVVFWLSTIGSILPAWRAARMTVREVLAYE